MQRNFPYIIQVTPPAVEPVSLTEAKNYLRVDGNNEDSLISALITASREAAESFTKRSLITQSWLLSYDDYTPNEVILPRGPVQSVTSVKMIGRDGSQSTVSSSSYYLNSGKEKLCFDATPVSHIVEIIYVAGFGNSAASVPQDIRQGMLAHISDMFEERSGNTPIGRKSVNLYSAYRFIKL